MHQQVCSACCRRSPSCWWRMQPNSRSGSTWMCWKTQKSPTSTDRCGKLTSSSWQPCCSALQAGLCKNSANQGGQLGKQGPFATCTLWAQGILRHVLRQRFGTLSFQVTVPPHVSWLCTTQHHTTVQHMHACHPLSLDFFHSRSHSLTHLPRWPVRLAADCLVLLCCTCACASTHVLLLS